MKILITGGLGFIGSNFILYWHQFHPRDKIFNLDKITYAANPQNLSHLNSSSRYTFIKGDICHPKIVDKIVSEVDIIVHFAAESHVDRSIDDPSLFIKTNVLGTHNLLHFAQKHHIKHFHHVSTDEVYGSIPLNSKKQFSESTAYNPSSPYSASKASSDHLVRAFYKTFGLPVTITNCSNNYGPFQNPEKMLPRFITNLLADKKIPVYGRGLNLRDWLYVTDHCRAIDLVINKGKIGETYCVGGLKGGLANIHIIETLLKLMDKDKSLITYVADRPAHDNYAVNWSKIKKLGWQPQENLRSGLQKTVSWYRQNQNWWQASKLEAEKFYKRLNHKK